MTRVVYRGMVRGGLIEGMHRRVRLTDYAWCKLGIQLRAEGSDTRAPG